MLNKIKVVPLAEESLGVRSMCTFVETPDIKVLFDAGVSLCPSRFGYPPHPKEYMTLAECRKKIAETAKKAEVVTISHYHFDHHTPSYTDWFSNWSSAEAARQIYQDKLILVKNYRDKINFSQRRRGWLFAKTGGMQAKKIENADGRIFVFGNTQLKFSEPVFHGSEGSRLGWLLTTTIEHDNECFMFAPDVQGPMSTPTLKMILANKPQLIVIGGPPLYLTGLVQPEHLREGMKNLERVVENVQTTILAHHLLRDENWRNASQSVFEAATQNDHVAATAAGYLKSESNMLESQRKQLFEREPPSSEFEKWLKLPHAKRKLSKPPL
ncbi:MAG: hypothetical protein ACFFCW_19535 [Candidatus Hodarchaeota archaeon]